MYPVINGLMGSAAISVITSHKFITKGSNQLDTGSLKNPSKYKLHSTKHHNTLSEGGLPAGATILRGDFCPSELRKSLALCEALLSAFIFFTGESGLKKASPALRLTGAAGLSLCIGSLLAGGDAKPCYKLE